VVTVFDIINRVLTPIFDLLCWPFLALPPIWAMTVISLVSGVVMVWIFGKVSDQDTIKRVREQIRGNLIGVRLFQSDIGVVLRLQRRIFGDTFRYMRYALVPMVVLLVPVVLIMTQLNLRFAARPLEPGEPTLIKAYVRDSAVLEGEVSLDVPDGVTVETSGVRIPSTREVAWRVHVDASGEHRLSVRVGGQTLETRLIAGDQWGAVPQRRTGRGMLDTLLYPGEPPIPGNHPVEAVEIVYPPLELGVFGWSVNWLVAFFVLSMVFGFAFKDLLGVEV
jgi:uncharacterized membrane protein (DUF106 family)